MQTAPKAERARPATCYVSRPGRDDAYVLKCRHVVPRWSDAVTRDAGADLTQTVSGDDNGAVEADADVELPRVVVAMAMRRPTAAPLRVSLSGLDEIVVGRGAMLAVSRTGRRATLQLPDHETSRRHAQLRRQLGGWELTDLGSKNGTSVHDERIGTTTLVDGDVIELGGTLLVFREESAPGGDPGDRDLAAAPALPAAFRTVNLRLERHVADLDKIAAAPVPVLIHGETGTGKELVAQAIHERSGRRGPFVAINCGALPRSLVESELFGYRRGAFSGAKEDREGLVRRADGGTLFLDEIGELPEESQVALLRVLQEGEVRPIGAVDVVRVDVRMVAATHQDLAERIAAGRFRQDLYARLAGFAAKLPPLRERREDLGGLIATLLPRLCDDPARVTIHRHAARALLRYPYPLNVRELEQALRAALVLASGGEIRLEHLPEAIRTHVPAPAAALRPEDRALRERLVEVLRGSRGNVAAAGRALGKAPIQIRRWCRRFGVDLAAFRR
jgi:transcriptional regulator with AAA-type ATPase domain